MIHGASNAPKGDNAHTHHPPKGGRMGVLRTRGRDRTHVAHTHTHRRSRIRTRASAGVCVCVCLVTQLSACGVCAGAAVQTASVGQVVRVKVVSHTHTQEWCIKCIIVISSLNNVLDIDCWCVSFGFSEVCVCVCVCRVIDLRILLGNFRVCLVHMVKVRKRVWNFSILFRWFSLKYSIVKKSVFKG